MDKLRWLTTAVTYVTLTNIYFFTFQTNHRKWQYVFIIIVAFMIVTNTIFVVFAKGTVQPWNFYGEEENGKDYNTFSHMAKIFFAPLFFFYSNMTTLNSH